MNIVHRHKTNFPPCTYQGIKRKKKEENLKLPSPILSHILCTKMIKVKTFPLKVSLLAHKRHKISFSIINVESSFRSLHSKIYVTEKRRMRGENGNFKLLHVNMMENVFCFCFTPTPSLFVQWFQRQASIEFPKHFHPFETSIWWMIIKQRNSQMEHRTKSYEKPLKLDNIQRIKYHTSPHNIYRHVGKESFPCESVGRGEKKIAKNS